jgi:hypothetical protein
MFAAGAVTCELGVALVALKVAIHGSSAQSSSRMRAAATPTHALLVYGRAVRTVNDPLPL